MDHNTHPQSLDLLPGRRTVFGWLTYAVSAAAAVVVGVPFVGYLLGARKASEDIWASLGEINDKNFPLNQTRKKTFLNPLSRGMDGAVAETAVYVRKEGDRKFLILAVNCAHLGCPVEWFQASGLFMCPCHGGVYYANGERASGPPPRGLFAYNYRVVSENGVDHLEIQAPHYPTLQDTLDGKVACCGSRDLPMLPS